MPMAGFYAIQNSEIRFGRDGQWYADGEPIANPRIAALFSRSVEARGDGGYRLRVGDETAPIVVDDTPYVVTGIAAGDRLRVTLNDGTEEEVDAGNILLGDADVFYCRVKGGTEDARLLRPAHYQLAALIEEGAPGEFRLRVGSHVHAIVRR